jgi:hypothetical protein
MAMGCLRKTYVQFAKLWVSGTSEEYASIPMTYGVINSIIE